MWTRWKCETCGKETHVRHKRDADVYTVLNAIKASHAKLSPICAFDPGAVRANVPKAEVTR